MTATKDILDLIETRLRKLNQEIDTLIAARAALDGQNAPTERARRSRTGNAGPAPGNEAGTQAPVEVTVEPDRKASIAPSGTAARTSRRPPRRKSRAKAARAAQSLTTGTLELLLADSGALTTSVLAERANANRDHVLRLLRDLEAAGRIRRTGQRRATRWRVITDEERIQERAAELAARSKPAA